MSKNQISEETNNNSSLIKEKKLSLIKEVKQLNSDYQKQREEYKISSKSIIETEQKFINMCKKINKIEYQQISLLNKIDESYIINLNEYKIDFNTKMIYLTLLGFQFPNQEPFYFDSPESLIAQLTLSKELLFNLLTSEKMNYDIIKSSFDNMRNDIDILKPLYDYFKLNFDIISLMQKREEILEENNKWIKSKDAALINSKNLEKIIKEKYAQIKNKEGIKKNNSNNKNVKKDESKILDGDDSHLFSVKDLDEISGQSFIFSTNNDNNILELFEEEEINKFDNYKTKLINHNFFKNNNAKTLNELNLNNIKEFNKYSGG